ncbi:Cdc37 N terminal kinase binding-domain-containing protein [Gautieria morchelliformis]|nr:Cdc37 N terminal kinase binding-domain-containing protein [Gautieria morchelliformis]
MARLNYSKWDQLELSDDSDIEGHPKSPSNVDKKSLIRWKQRDIHEKREIRRHRIAQLRGEIACNEVLLPRLRTITNDVQSGGHIHFSSLVERLKTQPPTEAPAEGQPTYDQMLQSLLLQVWEETKEKGVRRDDPELDKALVDGLQGHLTKLGEHQENIKVELEAEEKEQTRKITSDDLHEGFDSKYIPPKPSPPPVTAPQKNKGTKKTKETMFETLNPQSASASPTAESSAPDADDEDDGGDEDSLPPLTPALVEFSKLPVRDYEPSWQFIQGNREVIVPGATDALLVEAFAAERRGEKRYAKQCVHQGLLLQYCDKLGPDGVSLFFKRMVSDEKRAQTVFLKDVEDTYTHLAARVIATQAEEEQAAQGREQIQLMQDDSSQPITFNVPDGPPPEDLRLEGGTEGLDIEQVRRALQMRWDVFQAFDDALKKALQNGTLEAVNKVLGKMEVADAEEVVKMLEMVGILSFADGGNVRDMTNPAPV